MSAVFAFTVVLEAPVHDEHAEQIAAAIRMLRGVLTVTPVVGNSDTFAARAMARRELIVKLAALLEDDDAGGRA